MKKFWIPAVAALALSLSACGGNTNANKCCERTSTEEPLTLADDTDITVIMTEALEEGDTTMIVQVVTMTREKMQDLIAKGENDKAAAYAAKLSDFVKNNAKKLEDLNVSATLNKAVKEAKALPCEVVNAAECAGDSLKAKAQTAADSVKAKAEEVKKAAEDKAKAAVQDVEQKTNEAVTKAKEEVRKKLDLQ